MSNPIHVWQNQANSFASDDFIPVDGETEGSRKMGKDTLLGITSNTALAGKVASEFNSSKTGGYAVGDLVIYQGALYKCTTVHTGAWNSSNFTSTTLDQEMGRNAYLTKVVNAITSQFNPSTACVTGKLYWYNGDLYKCNTTYTGAWDSSKFTATTIDAELRGILGYTTDVAHNFAPEFDSTVAYTKGQFVTYQGKIYQFTSDHSAGAWNASHATVSGQNALLKMTTQNALAGNIAEEFVPNSTNAVAGIPYMYNSQLYIAKEDYSGAWNASKFEHFNLCSIIKRPILCIHGVVTSEGISTKDHVCYYREVIPPQSKFVMYQEIAVDGANYGVVFLDSEGNRVADSFVRFNTQESGTFRTISIPESAAYFLGCYLDTDYTSSNNKSNFKGVYFFGNDVNADYMLLSGNNLSKFTTIVNKESLLDISGVCFCLDKIMGYNVNYLDGSLNSIRASNSWYCDIVIPQGSLFVSFPTFRTNNTNGCCFLDENDSYISGFGNRDKPTGTIVNLVIPANAKKFRFCYVRDSHLIELGADLFKCVYFRGRAFVDCHGTRLNNGVDARNGGVFASDNLFHILTPIPDGAKSVYMQILRNIGYSGCVFYDETMTYLSGLYNLDDLTTGSLVSRVIPKNAKFIAVSYITDTYAAKHGLPAFNGIRFEFDKMHLPTSRSHCFKNKVHKKLLTIDDSPNSSVLDTAELVDDSANIQLPKTYTADGEPVRLVIYCHGAGAQSSKYTKESWVDDYQTYWTKFGYAVLDVKANPDEVGGGSVQHYGHPGIVECHKKAYEYVINHFNVRLDGVIVVGSSMGGLSSFEVVDSGIFPVLCQVANCPCIDLFKQAYCNPWINSLREDLCEYFNFEGVVPTFTTSKPPTAEEVNYFVTNFKKTIGFYPILKNVVSGDIASIFDYIPSNVTALTDNTEKAIYDRLTAIHGVPIIIFHCQNDTTVAYRYSQYWVDMVRRGGCLAYLRTFPTGGHAAWAAGDDVTMTDTDGNAVVLKASQFEAIQFARRYE